MQNWWFQIHKKSLYNVRFCNIHSKKPESFSRYKSRGIGQVLLVKKIVKALMYFYFYLPLEKGVALHLKTLGSLLLKDTLCQVVFNLAQWLRRRGWKYEKLSDKRKTDDRRYEQLTCSSGELKTVQKWQFTESFKLEICFVACTFRWNVQSFKCFFNTQTNVSILYSRWIYVVYFTSCLYKSKALSKTIIFS